MFKNYQYWEISSQVAQECAEGSTTRAWSPVRTVKPHECSAVKCCSKCGTEKPLTEFSKKAVWCKPCVSQYDKEIYRKKREKILEMKREYRANNKGKISKLNKDWQQKNKEKLGEYQKKYRAINAAKIACKKKAYYEANKAAILEQKQIYNVVAKDRILESKKLYYSNPENYAKFAVRREKRRLSVEMATPSWADISLMVEIYAKCKRISKETGITHHVDHIVPLKNKMVCGLHVHDNLRIVTAAENYKKHNHLIEDIVCSPVKAGEVLDKEPAR